MSALLGTQDYTLTWPRPAFNHVDYPSMQAIFDEGQHERHLLSEIKLLSATFLGVMDFEKMVTKTRVRIQIIHRLTNAFLLMKQFPSIMFFQRFYGSKNNDNDDTNNDNNDDDTNNYGYLTDPIHVAFHC